MEAVRLSVATGKVHHMGQRIEDWWTARLWLDRVVPVVVVATHAVLVWLWGVPLFLGAIKVADRPTLYGASAFVVTLTGTLASVSVGQYIGGRGDRVMALKRVFGRELGSVWRGTFLGSGFAAALFLVALGLDLRANASDLGVWVFEFGAAIAATHFVRLALLFSRVIELVVLDDTDPLSQPLHELDRSAFLPQDARR